MKYRVTFKNKNGFVKGTRIVNAKSEKDAEAFASFLMALSGKNPTQLRYETIIEKLEN